MNPYRHNQGQVSISTNRTFRGKIRSIFRSLLIWWYGRFIQRFPVKCLVCKKSSWNPNWLRNPYYWRCGHLPPRFLTIGSKSMSEVYVIVYSDHNQNEKNQGSFNL